MRYQLTATMLASVFFISCGQKTRTYQTVQFNQPDSSQFLLEQLNDLQRRGTNTAQYFIVKAGTKKTIQAERGLRVIIDPENLETVSGKPVNGDIEVKIIEAYGAEDFIRNNIPTSSDGELLVSGGSYYVEMIAGNEELRLRDNKNLTIEMPRFSNQRMELFYGETDSNGRFNWVQANEPVMKPEEIKVNSPDSIVKSVTLVKRIPIEKIKETDFVLMYADSVMRYRLDSICLNHRTIKRNEEINAMYRPIVIKRGYVFNSCGVVSQTTMIRPNYRVLNLQRFKKTNDTLEISSDSMFTESASKTPCDEQKTVLYYQPVEIKQMGWINCDFFYKTEKPLIPITLNFDTADRIRVCKAYYIFKNINSCLSENFIEPGNNFLSKRTTVSIPKGMILTIKIMAVVNGRFQVLDKEVIADDKNTVEVSFGKQG